MEAVVLVVEIVAVGALVVAVVAVGDMPRVDRIIRYIVIKMLIDFDSFTIFSIKI